MRRLPLHWQIAGALAAAIVAGSLTSQRAEFIQVYGFVGNLFLDALKMLIVPLIVAAMVNGMLGLTDRGALGRLGWKTALYYAVTILLATLTGLVLVDLVAPGIIGGHPAGARLGLDANTQDVIAKVASRGGGDLLDVFQRMIPSNIFAAAVQGEMLGLIFFSLLFGAVASRLPEQYARPQREFWSSLYETMLAMTHWVMAFAPLGVFALVAKTVASTGWQAVTPLALFVLVVFVGLVIQTFVWLPLILRWVARVSPARHFEAMTPVLLTAFSTSSSVATLPVTMDCVQNRAGVSPQIASFVLPLGATVNMNGTALYECAAAMFIAQAYGVHLGFGAQFVVVLLALATSVGVAGIPSASLVAIAVILQAVGLPLEGVGLILAVDRILDMCRTAVNVFGDTVGAVTVARLEGEENVLACRTAKGGLRPSA